MNTTTYKAPWGKTLRWVSVLATAVLLCAGIALIGKPGPELVRWLAILPVLILPGTALFMIRSYAIEPNELATTRRVEHNAAIIAASPMLRSKVNNQTNSKGRSVVCRQHGHTYTYR